MGCYTTTVHVIGSALAPRMKSTRRARGMHLPPPSCSHSQSGESPVRAAANAACAAAIAIEAPGPEGLTGLARFQDRLARYQQSDD